MTMTNAAIILAKLSGLRVAKMKAHSYYESFLINSEMKRLINFLDACPTCKMKPIFDRFWVIDSGRGTFAMLGEYNSKCHFVIAWD
jgi:hypothetical protein